MSNISPNKNKRFNPVSLGIQGFDPTVQKLSMVYSEEYHNLIESGKGPAV